MYQCLMYNMYTLTEEYRLLECWEYKGSTTGLIDGDLIDS